MSGRDKTSNAEEQMKYTARKVWMPSTDLLPKNHQRQPGRSRRFTSATHYEPVLHQTG